MPKIKEYNEEETVKLDECFKETLTRVKPFILALTCTQSAQLCKVWLNKLHDASSQRRLRNEYLMELYRQLKTGRVGGIFNTLPPNGSLLPLPKSYHMVYISSSVTDLSDYAMRPQRSCTKPSTKCIQHQRSKALLKNRVMDVANMSQCLHAITPFHTVQFNNQSIVLEIDIHQSEIMDILLTASIITELRNQNEYVWDQLSEYPKNRHRITDDHISASISQLSTDVSVLKAKLTEIQKSKNSLEENYKETVQGYHCTVVEQFNELAQQLNQAQQKNEVLDNAVTTISKKLEEITNSKDEEIKVLEREWTDKIKAICERFDSFTMEKNKELQLKQTLLEKKDREMSKKDTERREEIELLTNKIQDLESKLDMKIRDEDKLQVMLVEQYANMKNEFNKMKAEMDLEAQKQNQVFMSKVHALKKAVTKLEKSKEKLEYNYERKLSHIVKNKDMEIKALQLQLHEQKHELSTSLSTKKQSEVDNIVSVLEERYKTVLAQIEAISESQTQEYFRKITNLEEQILSVKKY